MLKSATLDSKISRIKEHRKSTEKLRYEQKYICPKCNKKSKHSWCLDCNCETSLKIFFTLLNKEIK